MGLTGAALGTTIGRGVGVGYQFRSLFRGKGRVILRWADFRFEPRLMGSLVRISMPGMLQYGIATVDCILAK